MPELTSSHAVPTERPDDLSVVLEELRSVRALLLNGAVSPGYLSIGQAARYLNTTVGTLREWVRLKGAPCHKPGKDLQFRVRELDLWMDRYQKGLTGLALHKFVQARRSSCS